MVYDISARVSDLHTPLALMEYDPAVSTVYSFFEVQNRKYFINQLRKVAQERQFMRSLVQISEDESTGRKSLVFTVDRITSPKWDVDFKKMKVQIGSKVYEFAYYEKPNDVMNTIVNLMFLLSSNSARASWKIQTR